ncbi:MAG: nuclear transport factor 2 family protein [Novosphingobium sp.]
MTVTDAIAGCERTLRGAMLAGDLPTLEGLISDQLIFTNHEGRRLSKQDDLGADRNGLAFSRLDPIGEPAIVALGDTAVVVTSVELAGSFAGTAFAGRFAYTRIWHRMGGTWRIEAGHCSALD